MKVDLVVNTMIQQIDRNLQSQVMPAVSWRAGELLRGHVMLSAGDKLQIRLDNGALLNAIPAGDVLLSPGATVTLRVSGQMDGQLVMQLLDQELTGERPQGATGDANALLSRMGLLQSPQGRAVAQVMERMRLPMGEETARTALESMARFPDLTADKAVFLAVNRIEARAAAVDALNRLVDGRAMTGNELLRLAELLVSHNPELEKSPAQSASESAQQPEAARTNAAADGAARPGVQAAEGSQPRDPVAGQAANAAPSAGKPGSLGMGIAPAGEDRVGFAVPAPAGGETAPAVAAQPAAMQQGSAPQQPAAGDAAPGAADVMLQLQSLIHVALGSEAADQHSGALLLLERHGLVKPAVALALDGPLLAQDELAGRVEAFAASLPAEAAPEARQLLEKLIAGLGKYMTGFEAAASRAPMAEGSRLARVVREIESLFARLDGGVAGEALAEAAGIQKATVARVLSDAAGSGAAGPEVARQMDRIGSHVQLIGDISQYAYRQIPVQLNGRQGTVELYVKNKGRGGRKVKADSANILIAWDTASLGHLETLITVSQKNLRLRFGVERPEMARFVESHMAELGRAIGEIGYRLSDMRTQLIGRPVTVLTATDRMEPEPAPAGWLDVRL